MQTLEDYCQFTYTLDYTILVVVGLHDSFEFMLQCYSYYIEVLAQIEYYDMCDVNADTLHMMKLIVVLHSVVVFKTCNKANPYA